MKIIAGVDEVGRGPLAGPVTVCVVACEEKRYKKLKASKLLPVSGKDSKKILEKDREKYERILRMLSKNGEISYFVMHVSNKMIDSKGISSCIKKAVSDCIRKLDLKAEITEVLLDGSLRAPLRFQNQKTIIKGDEKEKIIAWASILAKVSRDSLMRRSARKYPQYGFEVHKGYGTLSHRKALRQYGLSDFHRRSFCRNFVK